MQRIVVVLALLSSACDKSGQQGPATQKRPAHKQPAGRGMRNLPLARPEQVTGVAILKANTSTSRDVIEVRDAHDGQLRRVPEMKTGQFLTSLGGTWGTYYWQRDDDLVLIRLPDKRFVWVEANQFHELLSLSKFLEDGVTLDDARFLKGKWLVG